MKIRCNDLGESTLFTSGAAKSEGLFLSLIHGYVRDNGQVSEAGHGGRIIFSLT